MMRALKRKLRALVKVSGTRGLYFPIAYDGKGRPPSARLLFAQLSFYLALASVFALHINSQLMAASITSICFFALCTALYMLRDLKKAKIDLDDREIEVESSEPAESSSDKEKP